MPSNYVNWELGGSHWDHFYDKRAEIESHAMSLGYAIGDMDFDYYNHYATTRIYQINQRRVRTRTVATIKTYYPRECTNTAHYLRLCQVLNYFDPGLCHYYDKAQGWTTRPRVILRFWNTFQNRPDMMTGGNNDDDPRRTPLPSSLYLEI
jgi:hypothetical protein